MKFVKYYLLFHVVFLPANALADVIGFEIGSPLNKNNPVSEYIGLNYTFDSAFNEFFNFNFSYLLNNYYRYEASFSKGFLDYPNHNLFFDIGFAGYIGNYCCTPTLGFGLKFKTQNYQLMNDKNIYYSYKTYPFSIKYKYEPISNEDTEKFKEKNAVHWLSFTYYFGV